MWLSFKPNHESEQFNSFVTILISDLLIGPIAEGKPLSLGSSQMFIISLPYAIAAGFLLFIVSVIMAAVLSLCILSPKYFSEAEFSRIWSPIFIGFFSALFRHSFLDLCDSITTNLVFDTFAFRPMSYQVVQGHISKVCRNFSLSYIIYWCSYVN